MISISQETLAVASIRLLMSQSTIPAMKRTTTP